MWGNKTDFSSCPMYHKSKHALTEFRDLEIEVKGVQTTVNKIELEHSINMQTTLAMKAKLETFTEALASHMEDEAQYHVSNATAIESLATSVHGLITNQEHIREQRELKEFKEEEKAEEWRKWWMKISASVVTVIIIGIGTMLYNTWSYGTQLETAQKVQSAILLNQENKLAIKGHR